MTNCCNKPRIQSMNYWKGALLVLNRMCRRCGTHWWGEPGAVKRFTRAEWDAEMNSPDPDVISGRGLAIIPGDTTLETVS